MNIAIIGAGMAGLSCADALVAQGHTAHLFDKGRGPGGRMSTRRIDTPAGEAAFDFGAQYFTVRDADFARLAQQWSDQGLTTPWPAAGEGAWIGVPGMNAMVKHMAARHDVAFGARVVGLVRADDGAWYVLTEQGRNGPYDAAVIALPAEQAAAILSLHDFAMARLALQAISQPCWTAMLAFGRALDDAPSVVRRHGDIAWAARNSAKPGRSGPEAWVVQAGPDWSTRHLEMTPEQVVPLLLHALGKAVGRALPDPIVARGHRWRFALAGGTGDDALWNAQLGLGVCGDWLVGPRVESAWLSGAALVRMMTAA
jgi:predicted NAD/FAD-dependent oxidoreductase